MNKRLRNLALSACVGILLASVASQVLTSDVAPQETSRVALESPSPTATAGDSVTSKPSDSQQSMDAENPTPSIAATHERHYAIAVADLGGLPADAPPGTTLDLWVTWDPPVTEKPTVQRLLKGVVLERIVPAITPNGPDAALLTVETDQLSSLIFGDRYGVLSVALLPSSAQ